MRICRPLVAAAVTSGLVACGSTTDHEDVRGVAFDTVAVLEFDSLYAPTWGAKVGFSPEADLIVVSPAAAAGEVYFFDSSGRYQRSVGRGGGGPGEFRGVASIYIGELIYIADACNSRITFLSRDGELQGSTGIAPRDRLAAATGSGDLVLRVPGEPGGFAAVRLSDRGRTPFIAADSSIPAGEEDAFAHFAASSDGGVWVSSLRHYTIRHYSPEGEQTARYSFTPAWFSVAPRNAERYSDWLDSRAVVDGLSEDTEAGLLWVKLGVPEAEYPDVEIDPSRMDRALLDLFSDEVVEALDVRTGAVKAHQRFPFTALTLLPGGYAWIHGEREDGEPQIILIRLRTSRSPVVTGSNA